MRLGSVISTTIGRLLGVVTLSTASASDLSSLISSNPFGGKAATIEKPIEVAQQLELRGVVREKDAYMLNIYDTQTKKSVWMRVGEAEATLTIRSYDKKNEVAVIEMGGRNLSLALKTAKQGASVASSSSLVTSVAAQLQVKAQAMAATAPPQSEVLRMEQLSQEVRLRREQRQKTTVTAETSKT